MTQLRARLLHLSEDQGSNPVISNFYLPLIHCQRFAELAKIKKKVAGNAPLITISKSLPNLFEWNNFDYQNLSLSRNCEEWSIIEQFEEFSSLSTFFFSKSLSQSRGREGMIRHSLQYLKGSTKKESQAFRDQYAKTYFALIQLP